MDNSPELPKVLVVDDEKVIREILADFLSMEGFSVRTAEDGAAALAELSKHSYDLVLSDLKMPNMGGLELLEAIGKHSSNVVVVIMTGFGTVETAIDAMKRGAYDYILKPFKVEEVVHTIRRALEKQKLATENLRLREALSLYKVSEAIAASLSLEEVLGTVTDAALHEVEADQVSIVLADGFGGWFERARELHPGFARHVQEHLDDPDVPKKEYVRTPRRTERPPGMGSAAGSTAPGGTAPGSSAPVDAIDQPVLARLNAARLAVYFAEDQPLRVHGAASGEYLVLGDPAFAVTSLIVTPLYARKQVIGFLGVLSYSRGKKFDEGQRKLLRMVASRASAAIENAKLYEDLKATFQQTIKGLASAIDKMDRYTAGHSERVAAYAQILAIKLGLGPEEVEIARQAALMHDIGKIGCVMNLNKPGKLSTEEFEVFKKHPGYGKDILEPITFLNPLIPGVHLHHERWDGRGYPIGLTAQDIPLLARIISVADTYDAMTSDRAYRKALPHEVAVSEICRCAGSQFDPTCANEFSEAIEVEREERLARGEVIPE
ncbi:MAG: response regulator [Sandaracinaceae bacterium]|nr:response regulator [Sandaracinaceae bacterium]